LATKEEDMASYRIHGTLLPSGELREVFVVDGRFIFEGVEDAETLLEDAVLIPGLVDAHAHLTLSSPAPDDLPSRQRAEASARAHLDAGVLLIREPGSPDHASIGIGPDIGLPRTITGGRFLAPPDRYFPGLAREVTGDRLPDAAEEEVRSSGAWAKVIGDSPFPGPGFTATYEGTSLKEAADRVHAAGGRIAIHCVMPEVIQDAIDAGFDSLEHASFLRADQIESLASRGIAWVPTCSIGDQIRELIREIGAPPEAVHMVDEALDRQPEVLRAAAEAGVKILAGTDAGMGPHGAIRGEIELLLGAGLDPEVALGAASWGARAFLGLPGIEEGGPADLVAFRGDPIQDAAVLAEPHLVLLDGVLVQDPRTSTA
jgi:imidazolonepropionase-like amidohydrolase